MKTTKAIIPFLFILLISFNAKAQLPFKFDSQYKTLYASDYCNMLQKKVAIQLIDVRSPGEFSDTSKYTSLNQGRLKNAINIPIDSIKKNIHLLDPYKNKTIIFYCSHSQRSRRVSKLVSENGGFSSFYNFNGGMSVINQLDGKNFPCKKDLIISNSGFKNLSYNETAALLKKEKTILIIDARPLNQFISKDTILENNIGKIKGAVNITYADLKSKLESIKQYKDKTVLIYGTSGDGDSARMAAELKNNGFTNVNQLLGGINNFIASQEDLSFIENKNPYTMVDAFRALQLLKNNPDIAVFDTRPLAEYQNKLFGSISYKNLGRIKNAVHVVDFTFQTVTLPTKLITPILIYGNNESYQFAQFLTKKGYQKVYILDGLYDFVWSGFNVENCKEAKGFVEDHDGLY